MSNKKQIRLNTIQLDRWFDPTDDSQDPQILHTPTIASLLVSKRHPKPSHSLSTIVSKTNPPKSKGQQRPSSVFSSFQHLQINRHSIQKYLPGCSKKCDHFGSQRFPKRQTSVKNSNAFKYYLNSLSAHRQYTESIAPLEQIHLKLSEITLKQDEKILFNKRIQAEASKLNQLLRNSQEPKKAKQESKRRPASSWTRPVKKKKEKSQKGFTIQPWETTEEKFMTQW